MKPLSKADDYDSWFRARVKVAPDGLKDGTNKPYTPEESRAHRADLIARIKARQQPLT